MKRITIKKQELSIEEAFSRCLVSKSAEGLAAKTISTYKSHFRTLSNYFDASLNISGLNKRMIEDVITSLRNKELSPNTISSYCRTLRAFLSWARQEGLTTVNIPPYRPPFRAKEKPRFCEVMILFQMKSGIHFR